MPSRSDGRARRDWTLVPLHPLFVGAAPVLFLFAQNADQQVTLDPLWFPVLAALAVAAVTFLVCAALLRDWMRGALLATLVLALFFSFGHVWNATSELVGARRNLAAAYLAVGLVAGVLIWRGGRWTPPITRFLNVAALALVIFNVVRVGNFALGSVTPATGPGDAPAQIELDPASRPDIFYIVLDRYANAQTLQEVYGHDNDPFLDALEERGFAVAGDSWANYYRTTQSLLASLGMDYIDPAEFDLSEPPTTAPALRALQESHAVTAALKSIGYEYIHLGSWWEPTATNVDADIVLRYQQGAEFASALASTTALMLLSPPVNQEEEETQGLPSPDVVRDIALYQFAVLGDVARRPGPTFVFAHFLVPHPPYVFDRDGSLPTAEEAASRPITEQYVRQLEWTNQQLLSTLDDLMDVPEREQPVIILQADEGPWPEAFVSDYHGYRWLEAPAIEIQEKFGILNALRLPGVNPQLAGVHARTSPVNEFRIVFNAYFDADLPLLPDITYLSPSNREIYDFVEYPRP